MEKLKRECFKAGTQLIKENEVSRKLFILRKGKVRVYKEYMNKKVVLAILNSGEIFGELSFLDAKPRSASVQAMTDVTVDYIDGKELNSEIQALPPWMKLIFSSVAKRFRMIDQKMTAMQSLSNFQKKALSKDDAAKTIYSDLLKMVKIIKMIVKEDNNMQSKELLLNRLKELAGDSYVSTHSLVGLLADYSFDKAEGFSSGNVFALNLEKLDDFEVFLAEEHARERYTTLSYNALDLLRKIITYLEQVDLDKKEVNINFSRYNFFFNEDDPEIKQAITQLVKLGLISRQVGELYFYPNQLLRKYEYHSIVKSFDYNDAD